MSKYFVITIDTEGDNLWGVKDINEVVTTKNADYLIRFQELCEKYNYIPTYLTNYEMANTKAMKELGREGIKKETLEIGAHIHAWNQPPYFPLIKRFGHRGKPYLGEYPRNVIYQKIEYLTKTLEDTFQCAVKSHRGGRWFFDGNICDALVDNGYIVDCTCTPGINWEKKPGWSRNACGTNWETYPQEPFFICSKNREKKLVEIPVTIRDLDPINRYEWFRPDGTNEKRMIAIIKKEMEKDGYIEFMIHSSEFMPGGSPKFKKKWQITKLFMDLEVIFEELKKAGYIGISLSDYGEKIQDSIRMEKEK